MSAEARWSLKTSQLEGGESADPNVTEEPGDELPANFATRLGTLAILNYLEEYFSRLATNYGLPPAQYRPTLTTALEQFAAQNKLKDGPFLTAVGTGIGSPKAVRAQETVFAGIFNNLSENYDQTQIAQQQPLAMQYCNEPIGDDGAFNGGKGQGQQLWQQIGARFKTMFTNMVQEFKETQSQALQPYAVQTAAMNAGRTIAAQAVQSQQGPLSAGRYESVSQLREELIALGPTPDTYHKFMGLVGPEKEDSAKDALASFYQGMSASLYLLYDMLVGAGLANPIDAEIVEKLMSQHPEMAENQDMAPQKADGLFMPAAAKPETLNKTAANAAYPAYESHGPCDNRMCPKIRQTVSTFICRNHCLDGLIVDDHEVVCGEAIWRQSVMDKFSAEYRDKDGKWTGGYIEKRFEVHHDDGGHPALLKPGQRNAPIHEDAWSLEKRLQEMRRGESSSRGYSETPGDPKGIYNFDQHDLTKGPKNPQLSEKKKDAIAKLAEADSMFEKTAQVGQPPDDFLTHQHSDEMIPENIPSQPKQPVAQYENAYFAQEQEAIPYVDKINSHGPEVVLDELANQAHYPGEHETSDTPPWGAGDHKFEKKIGEYKYVLSWNSSIPTVGLTAIHEGPDLDAEAPWVKPPVAPIQAANEWSLVKEAWGMDPMMDNVDHGARAKKCAACGKIMGLALKQCDNPLCRSTNLTDYTERDIQSATNFVTAPDIKASLDATVKCANGVYQASKNGLSFYGDSEKEALEKLAQGLNMDKGLAHTTPLDVESEAEKLMGLRQQEDKEIPMAAPNANSAGSAVAQPVPPQTGPILPPAPQAPQGKIVLDEAKPVNQTSPVPTESQGPSEFFPPEVVGPEGWSAPGEEPGPDEGHVSGHDLDREIETARSGMHPDDHRTVVDQAIMSGAHPRQGE